MSVLVGNRRCNVVGERPCACGCEQMIRLTTYKPRQKFINRAHVHEHYANALVVARRLRMVREQEEKWGAMIDALVADGRVTRTQLLALCNQVHRAAYNTVVAHRSAAKKKEAA